MRDLATKMCRKKTNISFGICDISNTIPIYERADRHRRARKRRGLNDLIDTGLTISGDLGWFVIDGDR